MKKILLADLEKSRVASSAGMIQPAQDRFQREAGEFETGGEATKESCCYRRRLRQLCTTGILIRDDFGLQTLSAEAQDDLFQIILARYEHRPIIITSNRDFAEWPTVFDNPPVGSAVMDRLVHRMLKLVIEGKSYRLDSFMMSTESLTGEPSPMSY